MSTAFFHSLLNSLLLREIFKDSCHLQSKANKIVEKLYERDGGFTRMRWFGASHFKTALCFTMLTNC